MVREVEHAVKGKHERGCRQHPKQGFNGLPIFKSLHNYHYGTFIITAHGPTPTPKGNEKVSQIATGETPSGAPLMASVLAACDKLLRLGLYTKLWANCRLAGALRCEFVVYLACLWQIILL